MPEFKMICAEASNKLNSDTVIITPDLADFYGLQENDAIVINVAGIKKRKNIKIGSDKYNDTIFLPLSVLKQLFLIPGRKYGIKFTNNGELKLGPVVGVMANVYSEKGKPFGKQSSFIKSLISYSENLGQICFGFSPYGINWTNKTISGYTLGKKGWTKAVFPFPDVVYPREKAYTPSGRSIKKRMEANGVKLLNPALLGKWQTYKILSENVNLQSYIPDTRLITNFKQVDNMIKKYRSVYLKPVNGCQGRNIIKVVKKGTNTGYEYQYTLNNKVYRGRASNLVQLKRYLSKVMRNRSYIVQKQINLIKSNGNILDVRILVQKDNSGHWGITGMAGRVGGNGAITSNISSGGQGKKVRTELMRNFNDEEKVNEIINEIEMVAIESARTLEKSIGKSGEMGIDIGIDQNGKVWFIEANLRPARFIFTLIGDNDTRMKSIVTPLLYARHLADFE